MKTLADLYLNKNVLVVAQVPLPLCGETSDQMTAPMMNEGKPVVQQMLTGVAVSFDETHVTIQVENQGGDNSRHEQLMSFPLATTAITMATKRSVIRI